MSLHRQSVTVLRFWYRLITSPAASALSHPARSMLTGICLAWTGHNNGAIEFTRRRHGAQYGLEHREVFERARRELLDSGLVLMTSPGGHRLPATYALANATIQATTPRANNGASHVPLSAEKNGASHVPLEPFQGASHAPLKNVPI